MSGRIETLTSNAASDYKYSKNQVIGATKAGVDIGTDEQNSKSKSFNYKIGNVSFPAGSYDRQFAVEFDKPFDNANYYVFLTLSKGANGFANLRFFTANRTENGFNLYVYSGGSSVGAFDISWVAIPF